MKRISLARLRQVLHYDPDNGVFTWHPRGLEDFDGDERRWRSWNTQHAGSPAGCSTLRYTNIRIDGKTYWSHRVAWFYTHGHWPNGIIDHRNGDKYDNRLDNLRVVCPMGNAENRRALMRGKKEDLPIGVFKMPRPGLPNPYMARIAARGARKYLGCFPTPEAASAAYLAAKRELHESNTL